MEWREQTEKAEDPFQFKVSSKWLGLLWFFTPSSCYRITDPIICLKICVSYLQCSESYVILHERVKTKPNTCLVPRSRSETVFLISAETNWSRCENVNRGNSSFNGRIKRWLGAGDQFNLKIAFNVNCKIKKNWHSFRHFPN